MAESNHMGADALRGTAYPVGMAGAIPAPDLLTAASEVAALLRVLGTVQPDLRDLRGAVRRYMAAPPGRAPGR
jgi:hypothetical protein